jgi:hypothetical protein
MEVEKVVLAHLQYLENVQRFLDGGPYPPLSAPTDCALGRWIRGEGEARYGQEAWFRELVELHKAFHGVTEEAVKAQERGDPAEAGRKMDEAYRLFGRIEHLLMQVEA